MISALASFIASSFWRCCRGFRLLILILIIFITNLICFVFIFTHTLLFSLVRFSLVYETYKEFGPSTNDLDIDKTLRRLKRERKQRDLHEIVVMGEEVEGGGGVVPNRALKD